ncbi:MAG: coat protein [Verrucomicrobiales bacterium]|nr:coat protein [Verrucomicrobiales bacterium]
MAKTQIADVIVPTEFEKYAIQRTAALSAFYESGIVEMDPQFDALADAGGSEAHMPFWNDLSGARQPLNDSAPLTTQKIGADQDIARIHNDGQAWSVNQLAKAMAGDDPMSAILQLVGSYWARTDEAFMISSLKGMFAAASMASNLLAIHAESIAASTSANKLTGTTFVDACQKLGDRADRLVAVAMHSATEAALRKLDLIDFVPDSEGKPSIRTFQGRRVIIDDNCPLRNGTTDGFVYTSYLFGPGAFGRGSAKLTDPVQGGFGTEGVELSRSALDSDSQLINRRRFILHPRGVKFTSASVAGKNPTDAEVETAANWVRVYDPKNVRIVAVTHNN